MARKAEIPAEGAYPESNGNLQLPDTSSEPTSSDVSALSSPDPSLSLSTDLSVDQRNQAPGIPDRRKSVRPSSRSQSRHRGGKEARKSKASPLSISMANMGNAMKLRDDDEDETPGEKSVCRCYYEARGWTFCGELTPYPNTGCLRGCRRHAPACTKTRARGTGNTGCQLPASFWRGDKEG